MFGGEGGIRTLETVARLHAFQACAFDHSATSPDPVTLGAVSECSKMSARLPFRVTHMAKPYAVRLRPLGHLFRTCHAASPDGTSA
jgi:hypothetical protein